MPIRTPEPHAPATPAASPAEPVSAGESAGPERYILRLYVAGMTSRSARAVDNVRAFCEKHLEGRYDLQVIDVYQQPAIAIDEQVIALPMLIKKSPGMERKLIGDMSDKPKVLKGLEINAVNL